MRKAKIIRTISPAGLDVSTPECLIETGMNVARLPGTSRSVRGRKRSMRRTGSYKSVGGGPPIISQSGPQKRMIAAANRGRRGIITATHMLESMTMESGTNSMKVHEVEWR